MNAEELAACRVAITTRREALAAAVDDLEPAPDDRESLDVRSDGFAEAIFLRSFTAYERDVENLFLHYVTGGRSMQGARATSYLSTQDEVLARKIVKGGHKFLTWAKPSDIRAMAETYIHNGWPLSDLLASKSQDLSDCERIRNRIAHSTLEAASQFVIVQRNMISTERLFDISPGQFLRIRNIRLRKTHVRHYIEVMHDTLIAICDPPP